MKKLYLKLNKLVVKYFGFMLYPTSKCGKEEINKEILKKYE